MSSEPDRRPSPRPGSAPDFPAGPAPDAAGVRAQDVDEAVTLTDAKAMRAVAHPVRMALIELFGYHETLTATQASELLGESPANCAFHLRTLAKYGFVREAGGGKGRERPWTLVNRTVMVTTDQPDAQAALAADELARLWFERWVDRARRAFGSRSQVPGWDEASGWSNRHVFLTPEEAAGLRDDMRRMLHRYESRLTDPALRPAGTLPVEWSIFVTPVPLEPSAPDPASDPRPASDPHPADDPSGADVTDSR
jgi:predicted transcriptional regulator